MAKSKFRNILQASRPWAFRRKSNFIHNINWVWKMMLCLFSMLNVIYGLVQDVPLASRCFSSLVYVHSVQSTAANSSFSYSKFLILCFSLFFFFFPWLALTLNIKSNLFHCNYSSGSNAVRFGIHLTKCGDRQHRCLCLNHLSLIPL